MPAAGPEYLEDPTDRLPARVVGAWAKDKQFYLGRYQTIFANAMRAKWDRLCYLDLFSGPGTCVLESTSDFYEGSALSAMARPFTDFIFVDKDPTAIAALRSRRPLLLSLARLGSSSGIATMASATSSVRFRKELLRWHSSIRRIGRSVSTPCVGWWINERWTSSSRSNAACLNA